MKRFLLIIVIGLGLSLTSVSAQNGPMYGGEAIVEMLKGVNEVQVLINGFEYDKGAIYKLTAGDRMTLEQAKLFGVETGLCCVCGILLTDPKSVANGIGPVCAKRV